MKTLHIFCFFIVVVMTLVALNVAICAKSEDIFVCTFFTVAKNENHLVTNTT